MNTAPDHDDVHLSSDKQPGDDVLEFRCVLNLMNFALKIMSFVFNMMHFVQ